MSQSRHGPAQSRHGLKSRVGSGDHSLAVGDGDFPCMLCTRADYCHVVLCDCKEDTSKVVAVALRTVPTGSLASVKDL